EQGLPAKHYGTPLAEAVSLGIHESQSRFWENFVGRSMPFVRFIFPRLRKRFGKILAGADANSFYRAINRVKPSAIRVEADEVTYNLHIVVRYELEKGLLDGKIKVKDLPALWNERMRSYLGVTPRNDAEGVLQDTHWAQGMIAYFPTYLLGNLNAAQLLHALKRDVHGAEAHIAKGEFAPILGWLRKNVHQHGRRYKPAELIQRATGKPPSAQYFLDYLKEKYGEIYRIERW
ncbi:MAG: carboxypeptidase M32, partial [bacterium]